MSTAYSQGPQKPPNLRSATPQASSTLPLPRSGEYTPACAYFSIPYS